MIEKNSIFLKIKKNYLNFLYKEEKGKVLFYDKLNQLKNFYIPICDLIFKKYLKKKQQLLLVCLEVKAQVRQQLEKY